MLLLQQSFLKHSLESAQALLVRRSLTSKGITFKEDRSLIIDYYYFTVQNLTHEYVIKKVIQNIYNCTEGLIVQTLTALTYEFNTPNRLHTRLVYVYDVRARISLYLEEITKHTAHFDSVKMVMVEPRCTKNIGLMNHGCLHTVGYYC